MEKAPTHLSKSSTPSDRQLYNEQAKGGEEKKKNNSTTKTSLQAP